MIRKLWNCVSKSVHFWLAYHVLIPPDGRSNSSQVPEAVGVDHTPDRRKVKQLQAHGQDNPGDNETRPDGPGLAHLLVAAEAEPRPQQVLHNANGNIGSHIIAIVPPPYGQVHHVGDVHCRADHGPDPESGLLGRSVQAEDADWRIVQSIQDACAGRKIICLLRDTEVTGVEDHTEDPARQSKISEEKIVGSQFVPGRYRFPNLSQPLLVCKEVEQGEEDRERLLDSHEAIEGPFAMVLNDGV